MTMISTILRIDWQDWTAALVVALAVVYLFRRATRRKSDAGCRSGDCSCGKKR